MKRFGKKRALVTGAGSGFGRALAMEFAKRGFRVGVADINAETAAQTVRMVNAAGGSGVAIPCDVSKLEEIEKMAGTVRELWDGVDILVNNAGVAGAGLTADIPMDQWEWILAINFKSVLYGCRTFIPMMEAQGGGHIVNMASAAGFASLPEMSCYNVPKAAVISLSETLRVELAPKNIGVTVITPTFFKTNLMDRFRSPNERQRKMSQSFFRKTSATAEDIAKHTMKCIEKNRLYVVTQRTGSSCGMRNGSCPRCSSGR